MQRFGSSVNLNVHFHVVFLDGVFARDAQQRALFHPAPPPSREELEKVVRQVHRRVLAWLARKGHLDGSSGGDASQEPRPQTGLDACAALAMQRGAVHALRDDPDAGETGTPAPVDAPPREQDAVDHAGYNLHASVAIAADDDLGRERLCRYGARPPLALDRLRRLPGGRVAYRIKKLRDGRAKHRVMAPLELLARLAALVPPPRYPLVRYHGVLGPRSAWRRAVVPRPRATTTCPASAPGRSATSRDASQPDVSRRPSPTSPGAGPSPKQGETRSTPAALPPASTSTTPSGETVRRSPPEFFPAGVVLLSASILSVRHWARLLGGALYAASPRVDWASLLRRSFDVDVLQCASCGGRLRVLGEVTEPAAVRLVLDRLGVPTEAPAAARARDPTELLGDAHLT